MIFKTLQLLNLILFSVIAGQSFFYLLGAAAATRRLSAEAFIEQRKMLDSIVAGRLRVVYLLTLLTSIGLIVLSYRNQSAVIFASVSFATLCLVIDFIIALKGNIPINREIQTWSVNRFPANWAAFRDSWLKFFELRELASIAALLSLLLGLVYNR